MTSAPSEENIFCKVIAAFLCFTNLIIVHQIDVISTHFAVAFDLPIHNIGIYFNKVFSTRSLGIALGCILFLFYKAADHNNVALKHVSVLFSVLVLLVRSIFLFILYVSRSLSYHFYVILSIEAFVEGFCNSSLLTIAPEHTVAIALAANLPRIFILIVQFVLDQFWFDNRIFMVRIQSWICVLLTAISTALWIHYNFGVGSGCSQHKYEASHESQKENGSQQTREKMPFGETLIAGLSPILMYFVGCVFRDFTYPGLLPYGLLERDKCHMINLLLPVANIIGPFTLFAMEQYGYLDRWYPRFNWFWILAFPMIIIFVYCFLAIHTRIPSARRIVNSLPRVLLMTLIVAFSNGFSEPLSYVGVAKVVSPTRRKDENGKGKEDTEIKMGDDTLIAFHDISAQFMRMVFAKLSVGYNTTRVSLGYTLPRFRPSHRMSKWNLFWYIIKNTFRRAFRDTINDFRLNIRDYI